MNKEEYIKLLKMESKKEKALMGQIKDGKNMGIGFINPMDFQSNNSNRTKETKGRSDSKKLRNDDEHNSLN